MQCNRMVDTTIGQEPGSSSGGNHHTAADMPTRKAGGSLQSKNVVATTTLGAAETFTRKTGQT